MLFAETRTNGCIAPTLCSVHSARAGPPTDQLRDRVDRVVEINTEMRRAYRIALEKQLALARRASTRSSGSWDRSSTRPEPSSSTRCRSSGRPVRPPLVGPGLFLPMTRSGYRFSEGEEQKLGGPNLQKWESRATEIRPRTQIPPVGESSNASRRRPTVDCAVFRPASNLLVRDVTHAVLAAKYVVPGPCVANRAMRSQKRIFM
jgi:hypothetical protein